jgi:glucose-6-phosphate isomerase
MWSAVGLPIALATGFHNFRRMLDGAAAMDQHFASAPFTKNLPMLLAAYGVWNRNFRGITSHAVLPYAERLALLPKHLQQMEMESNGKSVDLDGRPIDYATSPVIFGEAGTNGQHSFHQLLHQGTDIISSDIIIVREREGRSESQHQRLLANAFAQANAFWFGNHAENLPPYRVHKGVRPVALIELQCLDAFHLGALIALYEHKVFAQGVIWHVNSFDQWGVELGKTIAKTLLPQVMQASAASSDGPISQHFAAR